MMFAHGIISPMLFAVCGAFKHHYQHGDWRHARHGQAFALDRHLDDVRLDGQPWSAALGRLRGGVPPLGRLLGRWLVDPRARRLGHHRRVLPLVDAAHHLRRWGRDPAAGHVGSKPIPDLDQSEKVAMLILAVATILFGIFPFLALDMMDAYTQTIFAALFGGA